MPSNLPLPEPTPEPLTQATRSAYFPTLYDPSYDRDDPRAVISPGGVVVHLYVRSTIPSHSLRLGSPAAADALCDLINSCEDADVHTASELRRAAAFLHDAAFTLAAARP